MKRARVGFTLIDRQIACMSNEKQLGLGFAQYTQDKDELWPTFVSYRGGWASEIFPYVKSTQLYKCPDDSTNPGGNAAYQNLVSYAYNRNLGNSGGTTSLAQTNAPASTVNLFEIAGQNMPTSSTNWVGEGNSPEGWLQSDGGGWYSGGNIEYLSTGPIGNPAISPNLDPAANTGRHTGGSNFLLADGHAKFLRGTTVSPGATPGASAAQNGNYACTTYQLSTGPFAATFSTL